MNYSFLTETTLFHGLTEQEIQTVLPCLGAYTKEYPKGGTIYRVGEVVTHMGLVLKGGVNVVLNDYWGSSNIFGHMSPGQIFAESYTAIPGKELSVNVIAAEPSEILFLETSRVMETCANSCPFHNRVVHNLLKLSAQENLRLSARMRHTASRSIRDRLISYLSEQAAEHQSGCFDIPFSRQQLADYLGADRSSLSNELSRMQKDGLLTFRKNHFELTDTLSDCRS